MAYDLNGSNQYFSAGLPVGITQNEPLTLACRFFVDSFASTTRLVVVGATSTSTSRYLLEVVSTGVLRAAKNTGAGGNSGAVSLSTWHHGAAVFTSDTSRTVYLNGVGTTNTLSIPDGTTAFDGLTIGRNVESSGNFLNGRIAEVGIWTAALSAAEVISLSNGFTPDQVRPESLAFYAPLVRNVQDVWGGLAITSFNSPPVIDHPSVFQ